MVSDWHEVAIFGVIYQEQQMMLSHQSPDIDPRQIQQTKKKKKKIPHCLFLSAKSYVK